jgi:hypothetical protein
MGKSLQSGAGGVGQVGKREALSSNPSITQKKKNKKAYS